MSNPDQEKAVRYRRSWRRVARRVLVSKNPETRKRWVKALTFIASYIVKQSLGLNKKKLTEEQRKRLDGVKAEANIYRKMIAALKNPTAKDGDDKLADLMMLGLKKKKQAQSKHPDPDSGSAPPSSSSPSTPTPAQPANTKKKTSVSDLKLKRTLIYKRGVEIFDAYKKAKAEGDKEKQAKYKDLYSKIKTTFEKANKRYKKATAVVKAK